MENVDLKIQFILELTELTRKYGISIGGCGCCGSPWLDVAAKVSDKLSGYCVDSGGDDLRWVSPDNEHAWKSYSSGIIRKDATNNSTPSASPSAPDEQTRQPTD